MLVLFFNLNCGSSYVFCVLIICNNNKRKIKDNGIQLYKIFVVLSELFVVEKIKGFDQSVIFFKSSH